MQKDLVNRFNYHPAKTEDIKYAHGRIRGLCLNLAIEFDEELPEGREKALAITKLEEAMFWANAAIARNQDQ